MPYSVFGVSINIICSFVQAHSQIILLPNTSYCHKMPYSVFGVSINIICSFVQAHSQIILLTLTSYNNINSVRLVRYM